MERRKKIWLKRFACSECTSPQIFIVCFYLFKAKQLHNLLQQLHGSIYELTERFERQKYDVRTRKKLEEQFCRTHLSSRWSNYQNALVKLRKGTWSVISFYRSSLHLLVFSSKAKTRKSNIVHTGLGGGMWVIHRALMDRPELFCQLFFRFSGVNDITSNAPVGSHSCPVGWFPLYFSSKKYRFSVDTNGVRCSRLAGIPWRPLFLFSCWSTYLQRSSWNVGSREESCRLRCWTSKSQDKASGSFIGR